MGRTPFVMEFGAQTAPTTTTTYAALGPGQAGDATENNTARLAPVPLGRVGYIQRLRYFASAAPANTFTIRVRVNGANVGAAALSITNADTTGELVVGHRVAPGDRVTIALVAAADSTAAVDVSIALEGELL